MLDWEWKVVVLLVYSSFMGNVGYGCYVFDGGMLSVVEVMFWKYLLLCFISVLVVMLSLCRLVLMMNVCCVIVVGGEVVFFVIGMFSIRIMSVWVFLIGMLVLFMFVISEFFRGVRRLMFLFESRLMSILRVKGLCFMNFCIMGGRVSLMCVSVFVCGCLWLGMKWMK